MTELGLERGPGGSLADMPSAGQQVWVRRLGWFAAVCAFAAAVFGFLGLVDIIKGVAAWPASVALVACAGLAGVAAVAAHRTQATLLARLDLFGQALEASPDAQLIIA